MAIRTQNGYSKEERVILMRANGHFARVCPWHLLQCICNRVILRSLGVSITSLFNSVDTMDMDTHGRG